MARPKREIDKEEFEKLCALQCTEREICYFFNVTDKTLNAWCRRTYRQGFSEVYAHAREPGLVSLRASQFKLAKKSASMAQFLGKNYLGQRDNPIVEETLDKINANMQALANLINTPAPNRRIEELTDE